MSFLQNFLNFFGTKSKRDMKELTPLVGEMLLLDDTMRSLSNNELREKSVEFKKKILDKKNDFLSKINDLKSQKSHNSNRSNTESIFHEIDSLEKLKHIAIRAPLVDIGSFET